MKIDPNAVAAFLLVITGLIGMPIIQYLKKLTGFEDKWALLVAFLVSLILAVAVSFANGIFTGTTPDPDVLYKALGVVFTVATLFYKVIMTGKQEDVPPSTRADLPGK